MKQSKMCCKALELAFEISKLIKFTPKSALFSILKAQITDEDDYIR